MSKDQFEFRIEHKNIQELPEGNTLIKVEYSSLNYKDALSATGNRGVTKTYPHTPGIDAAGIIETSESEHLQPGAPVVVNGYDLGMNTWGGYSEYIRVPDKWVLPLPKGLTTREAMVLGTAGLTAGLSVSGLLENGIKPNNKIIVTGATGGVGLISLLTLNHIGFSVHAFTGKEDQFEFLREIGASEVHTRNELLEENKKPLLKGEYAGAVDVAGGNTLAGTLKRIQYGGVVTCCGLVDSPKLETTVFPFILRSIRLIGIDSAECSLNKRKEIWDHFAKDWKIEFPEQSITESTLEEVPHYIEKILKGEITGRVIVKL
jgi:putative YhdH/YhfP family quinone oxidoreductase